MERVSDASGQRGPWTETEHERTAAVPERVWGPLSAAETAEFGAHTPVSSVVLGPRLHMDLLEAVEAEVLKDAVPSPVETLDELRAARLSPLAHPHGIYGRLFPGAFPFSSSSGFKGTSSGAIKAGNFPLTSGRDLSPDKGDRA